MSAEIDRQIRVGWMSFNRYRAELYDSPMDSLDLETRMVKSEVVEALLYGCAAWTLLKRDYQKLRAAHHRMLLRILGAWCRSRDHRILSYISPFNGRIVRILRPPCARGGCCGQGHSSEWKTADCPDGTWWGPSRIQAGVNEEARRKSGRIAWQTTYGCSGSGMGRDGKLWH